MNVIFTTIILLSSVITCIFFPQEFLPALLGGAKSALTCSVTLFAVYAVWSGLSAVAEDCRITHGISKAFTPLCKRIFKTKDEEAVKNLSMNISCNLLGIGGAATPYGVKAVEALERENNTFAQNLLFIINATSIQIIPTTVISLRAANGSAAAYDIFLPSLLATIVSTLCAAGLYLFLSRVRKKR